MREIEIRGGEATASPSAVAAGLAGVIRGGDDGVFSVFQDGGGDLGSVVSFLMSRINLVRRWVRDLVRFGSRVQVSVNRSQRFGI
ncbi:hypothetical protein HanXRQr2_Chr07g0310591 [Helianthus annuus]|uniref:Uncharacterized protein n=1 Tax=Helianthus annuus TaxID=4232 RepID=A0A251UCU7_HELAN|nr:hypothetical protein HanXRQr2_Chr07g0310591 [Helianthus annuus]KAJ0558372.1 hypothetical protein HanIR_Chr07g0335551 [Helianthus annuus]KAJ0732385.1 hypothetical protein HanOQP8_Chr07g0262591 [Helianthus annuus]KAJ0906014.1 hypothetical protein HanPSC8_Chr07g0300641 [Helianthus annuus]